MTTVNIGGELFDQDKLIELWQVSRTPAEAEEPQNRRHFRMMWAAHEYVKEYGGAEAKAYMALEAAIG